MMWRAQRWRGRWTTCGPPHESSASGTAVPSHRRRRAVPARPDIRNGPRGIQRLALCSAIAAEHPSVMMRRAAGRAVGGYLPSSSRPKTSILAAQARVGRLTNLSEV